MRNLLGCFTLCLAACSSSDPIDDTGDLDVSGGGTTDIGKDAGSPDASGAPRKDASPDAPPKGAGGTSGGGGSVSTTDGGTGGTVLTDAGPPPADPSLDDRLRFDKLPFLRLRTHAGGTSSGSMLDDNGDYNHWLDGEGYQVYLGEYVLLEATGPGALLRFWQTDQSLGGVYHFYFDGATTPAITKSASELWDGQQAPFSSPLEWTKTQSSGGWVSYVPMFFQKGMRVTVTQASGTEYWNIGYVSLEPDSVVSTFTGSETFGELRAAWSNAGQNPIFADTSEQLVTKTVDVGAGATTDVASIAGAREITEIRLTSNATAAQLNAVHLQITWDGESAPAVDAPLVDFFGSGLTYQANVKSLPLGNTGGSFYCYFPMPFAKSASVRLVNADTARGVSGLAFTIKHRAFTADFSSVGTFHAAYRSSSSDGDEYPFLDVKGSGHLVGVSIGFPGKGPDLEGNENIYIDGMRFPSIHGTGTEDFFNGGWYFIGGTFSLPTHGASLEPGGNGPLNAYRFFLNDAIPFSSSILARIQHRQGSPYSSVAYYYLNPTVWSNETDRIDLSSAASISSHAYAAQGATALHVTDKFFLDPTSRTYSGNTFAAGGKITLHAAIAPNNDGVALRRVLFAAGSQSAEVRVDGQLVGIWQTLEAIQDASAKNPAAAHLYEREYWIPASFTQGKSSIDVELDVKSPVWNELEYTIRSRAASL
jgi:hypothetical protein